MTTPTPPSPQSARPATRRLVEAILLECCEKHSLHPFESNLNHDYHLTMTLSVQEIRNFLIENWDCWDGEQQIMELLDNE